MSARSLVESSVMLLKDYLKSNIAAALAAVRAERADPVVSTEPPQSFFIYPRAMGYKTPAVFVIAEDIDMQLENGPNAIMAKSKINISVVVEDRDRERLTIKAWRYQDALHSVLDQLQLVSSSGDVKIVCRVIRCSFSPMYSKNKDEEAIENTFRKEVLLECDVHHFERP